MAWIVRAEDVKNLDTELERLGLLNATVENAGRSVAEKLLELYPAAGLRVLVLAGKGYNGADALVAARHLYAKGVNVTALALSNPWQPTFSVFKSIGALNLDNLEIALRSSDVVLDGLMGTGVNFDPKRLMAPTSSAEMIIAVIRHLANCRQPIVSIDLPSGMPADLPQLLGSTIKASHTLALGGLKPSLLFSPTREQAGQIHILPLAFPSTFARSFAYAQTLEPLEVMAALPQRRHDAHKGNAGEVWIVGGSAGMQGAPLLAAQAALYAGAGLVRTFSHEPLSGGMLELIHHPLSDLERLPKPSAIALGMGFGSDAPALAKQVLSWNIPTVIDADALHSSLEGLGHSQTIFTPHPKEASRMLGKPINLILKNPLESALELRARFGGQAILKGGPTVLALSDTAPSLRVNSTGNPGMASAGMGDVLAGILASLLAQGKPASSAAPCGVFLHGLSGDALFAQEGYGLQASKVAEGVGRVWRALERKE
jgi:ADP-dependent NAD(P)H-hydrate dehydratase / NAD(P)H-hydrate epimerase